MLTKQEILELLNKHIGISSIKSLKPLEGGCADYIYKIETSKDAYFLKYYSAQSSKVEVDGLGLLKLSCSFKIPDVVGWGEKRGFNYLLLEWIESGVRSSKYWEILGENLAELHSVTSPAFGLDYDNYIGKLPQLNTKNESWIGFFIHCRLLPQLKLAESRLFKNVLLLFDELLKKLPELLPNENPSLLHGDLWSGNVLISSNGLPALIDPAVYYGNREIEIAFTYLFGGFDLSFYKTYANHCPLKAGFEKRIDLYNLYPLLVHVNMFGGGYATQVERALKNYV